VTDSGTATSDLSRRSFLGRRQVQLLQTSQPILAGLAQGGKVEVIGAGYEITTGIVDRI
jgi:carbonic anhydrase